MNENYNKHLATIIAILVGIVFVLSYCSSNRRSKVDSTIKDSVYPCQQCNEFYECLIKDTLDKQNEDSINSR